MNLEISLTVYQIASTLGFSVGFLWGEAFGGFDAAVKYGDNGYEAWPRWVKFIVGALLDANHHFQYGLAVMLVAMLQPTIRLWGWVFDFSWLSGHPTLSLMLLWLGFGLVVSDWKDYQNVLSRMNVGGGDEEGDT